MPLYPPSPGLTGRRRSKDRDKVECRVATGTVVLQFVQDAFERHDGDRLAEASMAERTLQQGKGQLALIVPHFLERQTLARSGDEVPIDSLLIAKLEGRFLALRLIERGQEMGRRLRHGLRRTVTPERRR